MDVQTGVQVLGTASGDDRNEPWQAMREVGARPEVRALSRVAQVNARGGCPSKASAPQ